MKNSKASECIKHVFLFYIFDALTSGDLLTLKGLPLSGVANS